MAIRTWRVSRAVEGSEISSRRLVRDVVAWTALSVSSWTCLTWPWRWACLDVEIDLEGQNAVKRRPCWRACRAVARPLRRGGTPRCQGLHFADGFLEELLGLVVVLAQEMGQNTDSAAHKRARVPHLRGRWARWRRCSCTRRCEGQSWYAPAHQDRRRWRALDAESLHPGFTWSKICLGRVAPSNPQGLVGVDLSHRGARRRRASARVRVDGHDQIAGLPHHLEVGLGVEVVLAQRVLLFFARLVPPG